MIIALRYRCGPLGDWDVLKTWIDMLLRNKNAIIYGGGGSLGGAVAKALAAAGAKVFLIGRTLPPLQIVAGEINALGGLAEVAQVDAFDADARIAGARGDSERDCGLEGHGAPGAGGDCFGASGLVGSGNWSHR